MKKGKQGGKGEKEGKNRKNKGRKKYLESHISSKWRPSNKNFL